MSFTQVKKILVLRFSALGDVAMTIPVIWSLRQQFPETEITFASRAFAKPFIEKVPGALFFQIDLNGRHKGFFGIFRLYTDLKRAGEWDTIADLHDVLRTKILRLLFRLNGSKTYRIDKGRKEKKLLTRLKFKVLMPLKPTVQRYAEVFQQSGLDVKVEFKSLFAKASPIHSSISELTGKKDCRWIGIAPFAKHEGKAYPIEKMKRLIGMLSNKPGIKIFLFGGGKAEEDALEQISAEFQGVINLAGKMKLEQELEIISHLDLMISMDSANMHLASLAGIPVVSIWGATHPHAGFYGWNQSQGNAVQVDLYCRPCSVFGNKPCYRKDYACMQLIEPELVLNKVLKVLKE
jgi:ADP-heptose:LPS heptosyltransferase